MNYSGSMYTVKHYFLGDVYYFDLAEGSPWSAKYVQHTPSGHPGLWVLVSKSIQAWESCLARQTQ